MNRIIIIGNGFDLAHGLKTGYSDFFDFIKQDIIDNGQSETYIRDRHSGFYSVDLSIKNRIVNTGTICKWLAVKEIHGKFNLITKNNSNSYYFRELFDGHEDNGYWSDLESCYFKLLKNNRTNPDIIKIINEEFEYLKNLLEDYLKTEVEDKTTNLLNTEFQPIYRMLKKNKSSSELVEFDNNYFVTFNYTSNYLNKYLRNLQTYHEGKIKGKFNLEPIHIHGALNNEKNPIILGYGDEKSEDYKKLEFLENNELLKNFKTFQYLRTSKYAEVLGLLEGKEDIYVQIIGHSCGLCDKALLRTIFQHDNVKHIEAVYYEDDSKYFENLYNISRIFDDNTMMRERMVSLDDTFEI